LQYAEQKAAFDVVLRRALNHDRSSDASRNTDA